MLNFYDTSARINHFRIAIMVCMFIALFMLSIPAAMADTKAENDFQNCVLDSGDTSSRPGGWTMCCPKGSVKCTKCKNGRCKVVGPGEFISVDLLETEPTPDRPAAAKASLSNTMAPASSQKPEKPTASAQQEPIKLKAPSSGAKPTQGYTPISKDTVTRNK